MIEVSYYYKTKDDVWRLGYTNFVNVSKAMRFIWMIKKNKNMLLLEVNCDDPYDYDYLSRKCRL